MTAAKSAACLLCIVAGLPPAQAPAGEAEGRPDRAHALTAIRQALTCAEASSAYRQALRTHRTDRAVHEVFLRRMIELGRPAEAYDAARMLAFLAPRDGLAWWVIAHRRVGQGRLYAALEAAVRALERKVRDPGLIELAGQLYAWYDTAPPEMADLPDSVGQALARLRAPLTRMPVFRRAYEAVKAVRQAQQAGPAPPAADGGADGAEAGAIDARRLPGFDAVDFADREGLDVPLRRKPVPIPPAWRGGSAYATARTTGPRETAPARPRPTTLAPDPAETPASAYRRARSETGRAFASPFDPYCLGYAPYWGYWLPFRRPSQPAPAAAVRSPRVRPSRGPVGVKTPAASPPRVGVRGIDAVRVAP